MGLRGVQTYQLQEVVRQTLAWTAWRAVDEQGCSCELRVFHNSLSKASGPDSMFTLLLQALRTQHRTGLVQVLDFELTGPSPFLAVKSVEPLRSNDFERMTVQEFLEHCEKLFTGLSELHRLGLCCGLIEADCLFMSGVGGDRAHADSQIRGQGGDPEEGLKGDLTLDVIQSLCSTRDKWGDATEDVRSLGRVLLDLTALMKLSESERTLMSSVLNDGQDFSSATDVLHRIQQARMALQSGTAIWNREESAEERTQVSDIVPLASSGSVPGQLGRFQLHEKLGEGAAGTVYRATDQLSGQSVALKILNQRLSPDPLMRRRFAREARLLERTESPFVVRCMDVNEDRGLAYLALEFVDGGSLASVLRKSGQLAECLAVRVMLDVVRGLAAAHREGICHRDIKPDNILLTRVGLSVIQAFPNRDAIRKDGDSETVESAPKQFSEVLPDIPVAKLSDFGLARTSEQTESVVLTRDGAILGTPLYMSPEQCRGHQADTRSDIYSVGATWFHLVSGRPPFSGDSPMAVMKAHCNDPPPDLLQLAPQVSQACVRAIEKCLAKNADARYPDAESLIADLERILHGEPTSLLNHPRAPAATGEDVLSFSFSTELRSSAARLWPLVSNTDRVNFAIGLGSVTYTTQQHPERGVERFGEAKVAGQTLRWQEFPYEWVEGRRLSVLREFRDGPFRWFMNIVELNECDGGGTVVTQKFQVVPRNWLGRIIARLELGRRSPKKFQAVYRQIDEFLQKGRTTADPFGTRAALSSGNRQRLQQRADALNRAGVDPVVSETLRQFLEYASDLDIARIRPYVFAERFQLDPQEVVRACLLAAREGLLIHLWDILCPSCRIPADVTETLASLQEHAWCSACDLKYEVDFASSVELIFRSHPDVRVAETKTYCIGGPAFSAHVVAQIRLAAGERFDLEVSLGEGTYRLRGPQLPFSIDLRVMAGRGATRLDLHLLRPPAPGVVPLLKQGSQVLSLLNNSGQELLLRLERTAGKQLALTAAAASMLPLFRELFPGDVLRPGQLVSVTNVTLMAVDFPDADLLYEQEGDAVAFGRIREELSRVGELVQQAGGAVVGRLGEGLLCAFQNSPAAVTTAVGVVSSSPTIAVRVAVEKGSAMVTTLYDRLDYFGAIVVRVRVILQQLRPSELAVATSLATDQEITPHLSGPRVQQRFVTSEIHGVLNVFRFT